MLAPSGPGARGEPAVCGCFVGRRRAERLDLAPDRALEYRWFFFLFFFPVLANAARGSHGKYKLFGSRQSLRLEGGGASPGGGSRAAALPEGNPREREEPLPVFQCLLPSGAGRRCRATAWARCCARRPVGDRGCAHPPARSSSSSAEWRLLYRTESPSLLRFAVRLLFCKKNKSV